MEAAPAALPGSLEHPAQDKSSGLAWKWILEKLIDLPVARAPLLKEIISHVPDLEESQSQRLLEKVAVRYLEEMVVSTQLDAAAIPLIKILNKPESGDSSNSKQGSQRDLALRVRTEAVLSFIRKASEDGNRDWSGFASALDQAFPEDGEDPQDISQRKELVAYLFPKNQKEERVTKLLSKYPLKMLQQDILGLLEQKRASFECSFLDQLSEEVLKGTAAVLTSHEEVLPADLHSPGTHRGSGAMNIIDVRRGSEIENLHREAVDGEGVALGVVTGQVKYRRLKITKRRKAVENQGEEVTVERNGNEKPPDAEHGCTAPEGEEEDKEKAVKRRRVFLDHEELTSDHKDEPRSRHGGMGTENQRATELDLGINTSTEKAPQDAHRQRPEIRREILEEQVHIGTGKQKIRNVNNVDLSSEDEDEDRSRHGRHHQTKPAGRNDLLVGYKLDAGPSKSLQTRENLGRASTTRSPLQIQTSTLTKKTPSEPETGKPFNELKSSKQVHNKKSGTLKALEKTPSELERERFYRDVRLTKKILMQATECIPLADESPCEQDPVRRLEDVGPAQQVSSEGTTPKSAGEWRIRKQSLRQEAMKRSLSNSRLMPQTRTPSQEELEKFFNDLRPRVRGKKGIGVRAQENAEHGEPSRFGKSRLKRHGADLLCSSCNKYYEPNKSINFDMRSEDYEVTPNVEERTFDWFHLKEQEEVGQPVNTFQEEGEEVEADEKRKQKKRKPKLANDGLEEKDNIPSVEFLEIGSDGHEERCHRCQKAGELWCCDGCPIAMHRRCLEPLSLMAPEAEQEWFCPVCYEKKAMALVDQAKQVAAEARAKFEAFIRESSKKRRWSEGGTIPRRKASKQYIAHGSAPVKMTHKGDDSSPDIRYKARVLLERCALRNEIAAADMAMMVRKASRPDGWRAIFHEAHSSSEDDSVDHNRQEKNNPVGLTEASAGDIRRNLNLARHGFRPVSFVDGKGIHTQEEGSAPAEERVHGKRQRSNHGPEEWHPPLTKESEHEKEIRSPSAGELKKGHCQAVVGSEVATERRRSSGTKNPPEDGDEDIEVESVDRVQGTVNGEVEGDKRDNDLEENTGNKRKAQFQKLVLNGRRRIPGLRRKVLPWTEDEEDALKEGVQRYSHDRNFQWARILEFGLGRFDLTRTSGDLKDKWRNLHRGIT